MFTIESSKDDFQTIILIVGLLISFITWKIYAQRNIPPGPWGFPVVGYLPFLGENPEIKLTELGKKYGSIFSLQLGSRLVVVLNDYTAIKEAMIKQGMNFFARPTSMALAVNDEEKGIINDRHKTYFQQRRFLISTLREFGMGSRNLEPDIIDEIHKWLKHIAKYEGKSMDPHHTLSMSTVNVISAMMIGERFEYDDPKLKFLLTLATRFMEIAGTSAYRQFFPYLKYLPFSNMITKQKALIDLKKGYAKFHLEVITAHQNNPSEDIRDYTGAYLAHRKKLIEQEGTEGTFDIEYLLGTMEVMFIGGTETVTSILRWSMLYLISNPSIQAKVHEEIDAVIGMDRPPSVNDQAKMNYTRATLMEVHRCSSLASLSLPHSNVEETTVLGYRIPKGTFIILNVWATHYDENLWEDVNSFKPERFLDENGNVKKCEHLIPFSAGKRLCVGESLARMELFLFFTSLFQRFTLLPENYNPRTFPHLTGITRIPTAFTIRAIQRENYNVQ